MNCGNCRLPIFHGAYGYVGPVCVCGPTLRKPQPTLGKFPGYLPAQQPNPKDGCRPAVWLTEADVRRIVREELAKGKT